MSASPQFVRFALIGVVNTVVHGTILSLLVELLGVDVVLSNLAAFMMSNVMSFFMNSRLTFHVAPSLPSYVRFFSASLLALGLTLAISAVAAHFGLHYLLGFLIVIFVVPALSFLFIKAWVFTGAAR